MTRPNSVVSGRSSAISRQQAAAFGFTLVEMLIAMAITLVMIGAVVTLFANLSNSVRDRRAVVEMSGQLRHARNMLQQDLQGATCNGLVWQRPDENQGYIEIIEGPQSDRKPSAMLRDTSTPRDGIVDTSDFDVALSILPRNNAVVDLDGDGRIEDNEIEQYTRNPQSLSPGGLGDFDDILMLTVRNEHEPFVGRKPKNVRLNITDAVAFDVNPNTDAWSEETIESPLAEVVWYAVENPDADNNGNGFFGEPGMRTIYRRTLLIAPWVNPYRFTETDGTVHDTFQISGSSPTFTAQPGLVRILPTSINQRDVDKAIACLIAFQERYDLSVRLEFDPLLDPDPNPNVGGRWKIVANTLGDLTKRENRYEHHFYRPGGQREFPFAVVSTGSEYTGDDVAFVADPETGPPSPDAIAHANLKNDTFTGVNQLVENYSIDATNIDTTGPRYAARPFAYDSDDSTTLATARAMLNQEGQVVRVVQGLVPLSGDRRGEDVMLTDALGFDLRVYDPGAFLYGVLEDPSDSTSPLALVLEPTDPAWAAAYRNDLPDPPPLTANLPPGQNVDGFVGQGTYVDLGYGFGHNEPRFAAGSSAVLPWFFTARAFGDVYGNQLAPGYAAFDTWSFHYENNGVNEDHDLDANGNPMVDEGTNGLDDRDPRIGGARVDRVDDATDIAILGPDDVGERETVPPYDKPLRGVQVLLRLYERDSRQIRQVSVNQSFVPE